MRCHVTFLKMCSISCVQWLTRSHCPPTNSVVLNCNVRESPLPLSVSLLLPIRPIYPAPPSTLPVGPRTAHSVTGPRRREGGGSSSRLSSSVAPRSPRPRRARERVCSAYNGALSNGEINRSDWGRQRAGGRSSSRSSVQPLWPSSPLIL